MTPLRVVLDTNVILSTLVFTSGQFDWLHLLWKTGAIVPLISRDTIAELHRVLFYASLNLSDDGRRDLLLDYLPWCETIFVTQPPQVPECRDPADIPFLELALAGRADALVTGDHDLLALAPVFAVPIITPSELRELITDTASYNYSCECRRRRSIYRFSREPSTCTVMTSMLWNFWWRTEDE